MEPSPAQVPGSAPFYRLSRNGAPILDSLGRRIHLNRFEIGKFLKDAQLSPLRIYTNFDLSGQVRLSETPHGCDINLAIHFYADEWSPWIFAEGKRARPESNGRLEEQYLEGILKSLSGSR